MHCPPLDFEFFTLSVVIFASGIVLCARELSPSTQLAYSKFATHQHATIPSKLGMTAIYFPSWVVALLCLWTTVSGSSPYGQFLIVITSLFHYTKRLLEVSFVHKYSGNISLSTVFLISTSYSLFTFVTFWFSSKVPTKAYSETQCILGALLFGIGEGLNYIHHRILSNVRHKESKHYEIPQGGLFQYLWCPHYLGEIISFAAMALISQHILVGLLQICSTCYLCTRAYNTRKWYHQKFKVIDEKWCIFPYIF